MPIVYRPPNTNEEFEQYFSFRWQQLRKPLGLKRNSEQDKHEDTAYHIAAFKNENIIGVGRLQNNDQNSSRIRYMAVDEKFRNHGIGSNILNKLETIAIRQNIKTCWLLAREEAVTFYLKNNYMIKGTADSEIAIPHKRMEKSLKNSNFL